MVKSPTALVFVRASVYPSIHPSFFSNLISKVTSIIILKKGKKKGKKKVQGVPQSQTAVIFIDIHTEAKPYHIDQLFFSNVYSKYYKRYKIHFYTFFKSKCIRYIENKGVLRCPVVSCGDKSDPCLCDKWACYKDDTYFRGTRLLVLH